VDIPVINADTTGGNGIQISRIMIVVFVSGRNFLRSEVNETAGPGCRSVEEPVIRLIRESCSQKAPDFIKDSAFRLFDGYSQGLAGPGLVLIQLLYPSGAILVDIVIESFGTKPRRNAGTVPFQLDAGNSAREPSIE
jgi:hypothetical protein